MCHPNVLVLSQSFVFFSRNSNISQQAIEYITSQMAFFPLLGFPLVPTRGTGSLSPCFLPVRVWCIQAAQSASVDVVVRIHPSEARLARVHLCGICYLCYCRHCCRRRGSCYTQRQEEYSQQQQEKITAALLFKL